MLSFECDYNNGADERVLENLVKTNSLHLSGYGRDEKTEEVKALIKKEIGQMGADVEFFSGGTEANKSVISLLLDSNEGVISATSGHVAIHEAGAIECTGHKVIELPSVNGKLNTNDVEEYLKNYEEDGNKEFIVKPGMVYISQPTEFGTLYSKEELVSLRNICSKYNILLYLDGARLFYALASKENTLSLHDISSLCDIFYIGGTKCGTLLGEAVVFREGLLPTSFLSKKKQMGSLLAKERVISVQFEALFKDKYYLDIGRRGVEKADRLKAILVKKGYKEYIHSPTNQIFVVVTKEKAKELEKSVKFGFGDGVDDDHIAIRFCTSWSTTDEEIDKLEKIL